MVCKNCGKEVPDGLAYCEACGAPIDEPVVIKMSKDDIKKAGKAEKNRQKELTKTVQKQQAEKTGIKQNVADLSKKMDLAGYVKGIRTNRNLLLMFVGSLILYIAPFLNWIFEKVSGVKRKANLFEMGMKTTMGESNGTMLALGKTLLLGFGIFIIVIGIGMLALSAADYIKPIKKYASNPVIRLLPILILIVVFILIMKDNSYNQKLSMIESSVEIAKSIGAGDNYTGGRGIGPIVYIAGLAVYSFGAIRDLADRKKQG